MARNPMLAGIAPADLSKLQYPVLVSPKLDGVRASVQGGALLSRSLKHIPNEFTRARFERKYNEGLDGELIVGSPTAHDVFSQTTSGVMTKSGEPDVKLFVFDDLTNPATPFRNRIAAAGTRWRPKSSNIVVLEHALVENEAELLAAEEAALADGYEGLMVRDPSGPHKEGRATTMQGWLLKLKRFTDAEAVVIGVVEELRNVNEQRRNELGHLVRSSHKDGMIPTGRLGALIVCDTKTQIEFNIGSGFNDKERTTLWHLPRRALIGRLVTYKHQVIGAKDKPRLPIFKGFRDRDDT